MADSELVEVKWEVAIPVTDNEWLIKGLFADRKEADDYAEKALRYYFTVRLCVAAHGSLPGGIDKRTDAEIQQQESALLSKLKEHRNG